MGKQLQSGLVEMQRILRRLSVTSFMNSFSYLVGQEHDNVYAYGETQRCRHVHEGSLVFTKTQLQARSV